MAWKKRKYKRLRINYQRLPAVGEVRLVTALELIGLLVIAAIRRRGDMKEVDNKLSEIWRKGGSGTANIAAVDNFTNAPDFTSNWCTCTHWMCPFSYGGQGTSPAKVYQCGIVVKFTGSKAAGDNLSFSPLQIRLLEEKLLVIDGWAS